jgi:hypothetical protein
MRITIDEQSRLVHALKGAAMLTLALPHAKTREQLEAAAWGLEAALASASVVISTASPSRSASHQIRTLRARRPGAECAESRCAPPPRSTWADSPAPWSIPATLC